MALDPYAACPCGSGKKFKWCCQPIHMQMDKAYQQDAEGQHDAALRIMDQVTSEHASNPEAWGRKAHLLYINNRVEEAENALQRALDINPNYPFGHFLRGLFREHEGELAGALLLFRRAADLYDPEAKDYLAEIYSHIADAELKQGRPVAAHAALKINLRLRPNDELRQAMAKLFGDESHLPASARHDYTLVSPPAGQVPSAPRGKALADASTGKLSDAALAFEQLTQEDPTDASGWYNLGLARAWLGDNAGALDALDRYVSLEPDETRAAQAWCLAEVLRFGRGLEDRADYVGHFAVFEVRDPQRLFSLLQTLEQERRLVGVSVHEEQGILNGIVLDRTGLVMAGGTSNQPLKLGAYLLLAGRLLRLSNVSGEALDRVRQDLQQRAGPALSDAHLQRGQATFGDVMAEALIFPVGEADKEEARRQVREQVLRYFEETWIHRPLHSLNQVAPIDAAGQPHLRKKLKGVVQFLEECATGDSQLYDFERLRRKLSLLPGVSPETGPPTAPDIDALGAAELAALQLETLSDDQVDQAYQAAQKLDAAELAGRFARTLVNRPHRADKPDRFSFYAYLMQRALADGDNDAALSYVDEGEKADCEHNEGRRRNDYELRRGQILSKRGDTDSARDVFERLIARAPSELRFRGTAAESMLSMKQGATALYFAEQGLAKAREKNDRDSEQYFMELVAAARKQAG